MPRAFRIVRGAPPGRCDDADDDHVTDDERRGVEPELGGVEVDLLIGLELQVDDAVLAERRDGDAGLRVERQHPIAWRDVDHAPIGAVALAQYARPRPAPLRGAF